MLRKQSSYCDKSRKQIRTVIRRLIKAKTPSSQNNRNRYPICPTHFANLLNRHSRVDTQTETLPLRFLLLDIARLHPANYAILSLDHIPIVTAAALHHRHQGSPCRSWASFSDSSSCLGYSPASLAATMRRIGSALPPRSPIPPESDRLAVYFLGLSGRHPEEAPNPSTILAKAWANTGVVNKT